MTTGIHVGIQKFVHLLAVGDVLANGSEGFEVRLSVGKELSD